MAFGKVLLLCGVLALAKETLAYGHNCELDLKLEPGWLGHKFVNGAINDNTTDKEFYRFNLTSSITGQTLDYNFNEFIEAVMEERTVIIKPKEAFKDFEYSVYSAASRYDEPIQLGLRFECGDGWNDYSEFTFIQPVTDLNNHVPTFNRKEYVYHFGMSIREGAVLTNLMEIYAVDIDYTNSGMNFTTSNSDIQISRSSSDKTGKIHYASLKTTKEFTKGTHEFTIKAEDNGNPKETGTAKVKIIID